MCFPTAIYIFSNFSTNFFLIHLMDKKDIMDKNV